MQTMQVQSALGAILVALGFIVAVVGPVAAALAANPLVAAHQKLVNVLAIVGVIAMACGVAHDAIQRWATQSGQTKIELAKINNSWTPTNPPGVLPK